MNTLRIFSLPATAQQFTMSRRLPGFGVLMAGWICRPALLLCLGLIFSLLVTILFMRERVLPKGRCGRYYETGRICRRTAIGSAGTTIGPT